jgi:prephenate dehydrogenase
MFQTIGIVGVGLIGGSLGLAIKQHRLANLVIGSGRSEKSLLLAKELGLIDEVMDLEGISKSSDLLIVCVPVAQSKEIFSTIALHLKPSAIVIDVGSTKMDVIASAKQGFGEQIGRMIACHPIAGGAQHGPSAARSDLFQNKQLIICPILENQPNDVSKIEHFWQILGSKVFKMSAIEHDHLFAAVSHLPHILSYAMMMQIASSPDADKKFIHAGAGFRDFTRIAGSSPEMWTDIAMANKISILDELEGFSKILEQMKIAIQDGDAQKLQKMFQIASDSRNNWQG